jgi:hypothetical protein
MPGGREHAGNAALLAYGPSPLLRSAAACMRTNRIMFRTGCSQGV